MKGKLIITTAAIMAIIALIFALNTPKNNAISLEESISTADADIKVQEKRRVDLVYNLAECVQSYNEHEAETLENIVEGRSNNNESLENITATIAAVAEAYPDLKASENYKTLMNELSITENVIAEHRSNYNKAVKEYRRYVRKFPNRQILGLTGYEIQEYEMVDYEAPHDAPQNLFGDQGNGNNKT